MPNTGFGGWGAGLRGWVNENGVNATYEPLLHLAATVAVTAIGVTLNALYLMLWGPVSWVVLGTALVLLAAILLARRWEDIWVWVGIGLATALILFVWLTRGMTWVEAIWPDWRPQVQPMIRILLGIPLGVMDYLYPLFFWRQRVEITDNQYSSIRMTAKEPLPALPLGPRFEKLMREKALQGQDYVAELENEIAYLQEQVHRMEREHVPAVQIVINGNPDEPPIPDGPNGPQRLASYFLAVRNNVAELSLNGAVRFKFSRAYAEELMAWLVECPEGSKQKYAYRSKRGDPVLLNLGRWMVREFIKTYKPDANGNGHTNGHPPTPGET